LTRAQCRLLGHLARNEGINQAGLADLLEIKPTTLLRQIDRMEEEGWIERRSDPKDRRTRRLVLTEKARPMIADIALVSNEVRGEAFAGLTDDEDDALIDLLRRVRTNLGSRTATPIGDHRQTAPPSGAPEWGRMAADLVVTGARP
jgi:DNA-binding MarR family transcriptional regulator